MIRNFFLLAVRSLVRRWGYSLLNISGLTLGLASALFIFIWVYDEISTNRFHENLDQIYRVEQDQYYNGESYHVNVTGYPCGDGWKENIPEITERVRFSNIGDRLLRNGDKTFYEGRVLAADSSVFKVFTFPLLHGSEETALCKPLSIVLSKEMAAKYFGDENPIGKVIQVDNQYPFTVTGVMKEIPRNSSLRFDFLVPFDFTRSLGQYNQSWFSNNLLTYVLLSPESDPKPLDTKLTDIVKSHLPTDRVDQYRTKFMLAPLSRMYLHGYFGFGHPPGRIQQVRIFTLIGIFVILIAAINYMNLATARSSRRSREIGLRKVIGAHRNQLINQFLGESLLNVIIALILAVGMVALLFDQFKLVSGKAISLSFIFSAPFLIGMVSIVVITALLAGFYPSIIMSGRKPVNALKGSSGEGHGKGLLRKSLVIIQFTISIFLITSTVLIYRQTGFMKNKDVGYDKQNIYYLRLMGDLSQQYPVLRQVMLRNPYVTHVTGSEHLPSNIGSNTGGVTWDGKDPDFSPLVSITIVDYDYPELIGIPIEKGRPFSPDFPSDLLNFSTSSASFLINETLAGMMKREDVVGTRMEFSGIAGPVVGIIRDFHFLSMRDELPPLAIGLGTPENLNYMMIRFKDNQDITAVRKSLESTWRSVVTDYPFEPKLLQDEYDEMYQSETRTGKLVLFFTIMAIVIACLGLFALASFMAEKRTREIGIRRTLGSMEEQIIVLMIRQFSTLVLISVVITLPLSYFYLKNWLEDYAYRTTLSIWLFVFPALAIVVIATLTVTWQAWKASRINPATSLKYE